LRLISAWHSLEQVVAGSQTAIVPREVTGYEPQLLAGSDQAIAGQFTLYPATLAFQDKLVLCDAVLASSAQTLSGLGADPLVIKLTVTTEADVKVLMEGAIALHASDLLFVPAPLKEGAKFGRTDFSGGRGTERRERRKSNGSGS
jgi:hypothetical protein